MSAANSSDSTGHERLAPVTPIGAKRGLAPEEPAEASSASEGHADDSSGKQARRATNVAVHQLARRGMSRWELEQVLEKRGVDSMTAAAELDRLESVGLVDDAALAVSFVYTQHTRKGLGRTAIAHELRRRHIDQETIDEALAELDDEDERDRARELAVKRAGQLRSLDTDTARRRLSGYLARKGYDSGAVRDAVDHALETTRTRSVRFE